MKTQFDVIIVGSGHAGVEASYAVARQGLSALVITVNWEKTAHMSCNPSVGGLGKGHIVKELDILGGLMGRAADATCIQFKRLNSSKGPAVRGSRAQCDKDLYSAYVRDFLSAEKNISHLSAEVKTLILKNNTCMGVVTDKGESLYAKAVVLTTGTFMKAVMHIGSDQSAGGRVGEQATYGLSDQLKSLGLKVYRLKTGTPPRLEKSTIDFSKTSAQKGDDVFRPFSFFSPKTLKLPQQLCYLAYTNEKTHEIIRKNLKFSPLFTGAIQSTGPRYCPSIEDKVTRFAHKDRHQSFLEPETIGGSSIYLQGISTSLPEKAQLEFLQTIAGLEKVKILKPGYAVEYDFFDPQSLFPTLETKAFNNLFFAGQINGSSGYEEAAGQGLIAGLNAVCKIKNKKPLILKRHEAYIGVLIDDLVTKGTEEPYRMLTSRAEHRLVLREDNVMERLFKISCEYEMLSKEKQDLLFKELEQRKKLKDLINSCRVLPSLGVKKKLEILKIKHLEQAQSLKKFFCRPEVGWPTVKEFLKQDFLRSSIKNFDDRKKEDFSQECWEAVEINIKYEGYIQREEQFITQSQKMENTDIESVDYDKVKGLSLEALEKLKKIKPKTLAQANRISGMPPAAIQAILIHLKSFGSL